MKKAKREEQLFKFFTPFASEDAVLITHQQIFRNIRVADREVGFEKQRKDLKNDEKQSKL